MSTFELVSLLALCGLAWFWLDTLRAREAGVLGARQACAREGLQLLDDTVAGRSVRLARNRDGRVVLQRVYDFEYSGSGNDRYRGSLMLLGKEVVMLDIGAHRSEHLFAP